AGGAGNVGPFAEPFLKRTTRQVVVKEALVSESQVDFGLRKVWVEGQDLFELFSGASELAPPHGILSCAERLLDLFFRSLRRRQLGSDRTDGEQDQGGRLHPDIFTRTGHWVSIIRTKRTEAGT